MKIQNGHTPQKCVTQVLLHMTFAHILTDGMHTPIHHKSNILKCKTLKSKLSSFRKIRRDTVPYKFTLLMKINVN